ncbi:hypothetical protein BDY19DRAFT_910950 [Irpex rosettiformis]|uniref:Uncharacterized protein n=2 Tax=Irpex rosettiformis TaxID=378272 RepID=A0ACB8TLT1_9APHY|nr:hypothetical protein BDY19DRAFT_910951 [Irpex rosettiformis]KAI0082971.1 hypothetical protein BDY19DRAFT_910950 [Irpex rosettiformis]
MSRPTTPPRAHTHTPSPPLAVPSAPAPLGLMARMSLVTDEPEAGPSGQQQQRSSSPVAFAYVEEILSQKGSTAPSTRGSGSPTSKLLNKFGFSFRKKSDSSSTERVHAPTSKGSMAATYRPDRVRPELTPAEIRQQEDQEIEDANWRKFVADPDAMNVDEARDFMKSRMDPSEVQHLLRRA